MQERLKMLLKRHYIVQNDTTCWVWQGQIANSGRGRLKIKNQQGNVQMMSAEDVSYLAYYGDIPEKRIVNQTCGNRLCVNPEHLALME